MGKNLDLLRSKRQVGSNIYELFLDGGEIVFFSYDTPVAAFIKGRYYRTSQWYSVTTSKHLNKWIDGEYEEKPQKFFDNLVG